MTRKQLIYTIVQYPISDLLFAEETMHDRRFIGVGMQVHVGLLTVDLDFFCSSKPVARKNGGPGSFACGIRICSYCSSAYTSLYHRLKLLAEWCATTALT